MTIAFYKVNNVCEYSRSSFNGDTPDVIRKKLSELPEDQVRFYDLDHYGYGSVPAPNLADFQEDYNDEELDGGWWCIVLGNDKRTETEGLLSIQSSLITKTYLKIDTFIEFAKKWREAGHFEHTDIEQYLSLKEKLEQRDEATQQIELLRTKLIELIMRESIYSKELRIDLQREFGQFDSAQICEHCGKVIREGYSWDGKVYCDLSCVMNNENIDAETANEYLSDAEEPDSNYYYTEW